MNEKQLREQFQADLTAFANRWSLTRVKTESINFDRDFQRGQDNQFHLKSEKAVIRALGKLSKVPIGEGREFKTFEEAEAAMREKWSQYFKERRVKRSENEKRGEQRRQKRYRDKKKAKDTAIDRQQ